MSISDELGANEVLAGQSILNRPAEEFINDPSVEFLWAKKAYEHAQIYFNIISAVDPKVLKLTKFDDVIYKEFREKFPDLKVDLLDEDEIKSEEGKKKWREFCEQFKEVDDYSFGTLVRANCNDDYSEQNSILVTRIQFFAIEIARNREGFNDLIHSKFKPVKVE